MDTDQEMEDCPLEAQALDSDSSSLSSVHSSEFDSDEIEDFAAPASEKPNFSAAEEPVFSTIHNIVFRPKPFFPTIQNLVFRPNSLAISTIKSSVAVDAPLDIPDMPDVKRTVKLITEQKIDEKSEDDPPLRDWSIKIVLSGPGGEEVPASIFSKVTYRLHETFGDRMIQDKTKAPFEIKEQGWGEFDMQIILTTVQGGGEFTINHDLNFQSEKYEAKHQITFKSPKSPLIERLRDSGVIPGEGANGVKGADSAKKKKRVDKGIDMDKLAEYLQKLQADDLIHVVSMIHDNKTEESWTKNDVEQGEFQVDLYTLPDTLVRSLWDFCLSKLPAS